MDRLRMIQGMQVDAGPGTPVLQLRVRLSQRSARLEARLAAEGLRWLDGEGCFLLEAGPEEARAAFDRIPALLARLNDWTDGSGTGRQGYDAQPGASGWRQAQATLLEAYGAGLAAHKYSPKTCKNYKNAFRSFLLDIAPRLPLELRKPELDTWLQGRLAAGQCSATHLNTLINALRFYYVSLAGCPPEGYEFARPKQPAAEPATLSKSEVQRLLRCTHNQKHRCLLLLAYGTGLRLHEILSLRSSDVDLEGMRILIRGAGTRRTGREVPLSPKLVEALATYRADFNPAQWLFEGERRGSPYSERSAQMVVKQAASRAGLVRQVSMHMLRHSYATHQLEAGIAMEAVQDLMGHGSIRTTVRYAHIARRKPAGSPVDDMEI